MGPHGNILDMRNIIDIVGQVVYKWPTTSWNWRKRASSFLTTVMTFSGKDGNDYGYSENWYWSLYWLRAMHRTLSQGIWAQRRQSMGCESPGLWYMRLSAGCRQLSGYGNITGIKGNVKLFGAVKPPYFFIITFLSSDISLKLVALFFQADFFLDKSYRFYHIHLKVNHFF